jgi:hypothetical protein
MSKIDDKTRLAVYKELMEYWHDCIDEHEQNYNNLKDHWIDTQIFSLNCAIACMEELLKDYKREQSNKEL